MKYKLDKQHKMNKKNNCVWKIDNEMFYGITYLTSCGDSFLWGDCEKIPEDFKYCPYCGKKIKISK